MGGKTGKRAPMPSAEDSLSWFDKFELFLDRCVRCGEAVIVLLLMLIVVAGLLYQTWWILWTTADCRQVRFAQSLKTIDDNWKVGLIILIPLFYRALRAFLERVEEVGGVKAPFKKKTSDPTKGE
jgi:hypothetical protein